MPIQNYASSHAWNFDGWNWKDFGSYWLQHPQNGVFNVLEYNYNRNQDAYAMDQIQGIQEANQAAEERAAVAQFEREQTAANAANTFAAEQAQLNRDWQTAANEKAMQFEADQARINREWQAQQTNTAYQRAVADLKAAGLNPILAAMGSGAASAAGAQASGVSSAGATAAASKASASKASVDTTTYREVLNTIINGAFSLGSSLIDKIPLGKSTGRIGF